VITFGSGFREDILDPVFGPPWNWMLGTATMRVRLERRGEEWVDAGSTFSMVALDEAAPYVDVGPCEVGVTYGGVIRPSGPLIIDNGDGVYLSIDRTAGTATLYVGGFSAPARPMHTGEFGQSCPDPGPWTRTDPASEGWSVEAGCEHGRIEANGTLIRFDQTRCTSTFDETTGGSVRTHRFGGSYLSGWIRLTS
jgi:hypothetical protein